MLGSNKRLAMEEQKKEGPSSIWRALFFTFFYRILEVPLLCRRPTIIGAWFSHTLGLWRNPPWESRFSLALLTEDKVRASQDFIYGETPLWLGIRLLKWAGAGASVSSRVVDFGAGRGRLLLAARWLGADASGFEIDPSHLECGQAIAQKVGAIFERADACQVPLDKYTHGYVAWTTWSKETRLKLSEHLAGVPKEFRLITMTWPIEPGTGWRLLKERKAAFPWCTTDVYLFEKETDAGPSSAELNEG